MKRAPNLTRIFVISSLILVCAERSSCDELRDYQDYHRALHTAMQEKNFVVAEQLLRGRLKVEPADAEGKFLLGLVLAEEKGGAR
ncbi:MAG: hypothetical protein AAFX06_25890 [Planctomycetota bacterium]